MLNKFWRFHEDIDMFEFWPIYLIAVILGILYGLFWSLFTIARTHDRDDVKHLLSELDDEHHESEERPIV